MENEHIRIREGLDIPVSGDPEQAVYPGQPLFEDKYDPAVCYSSPGRGHVVAINRGARRALDSVVVRIEENGAEGASFKPLSLDEIRTINGDQAAIRLQQSGLWTAFRTRPFSRVPLSGTRPNSLFVTAIDTRPLAANPAVVIAKEQAAFIAGLQVLTSLTDGTVFLCTKPQSPFENPDIDGVRHVSFSGPHPAGLAGTHIHFLDPVDMGHVAWHIGYQDVIAIGFLFISGAISTGRVVALGGDGVGQPRLVSTRLGASTGELLEGSLLNARECRVVSGSVLDGRTAVNNLAFLGRYHQQVSVIHEGGKRRLLGWAGLFPRRYTATASLIRKKRPKQKWAFTTSQNGRFTGMIPLRAFEKLTPLDILPSLLFRALMVRDTDQAQALGCLELDEEDLALCSFVCPAKYDYGTVLRVNLDQIEKEG
jgi:Na+-transporting NADH:ubiquinone oxidoreductase subunit A